MDDEDTELFRRAMADAKPIKTEARAKIPRRKPKPAARFSRADDARTLQDSLHVRHAESRDGTAHSLRFRREGVGFRTMRRLARGRFSVQEEIDLHGMTQAEAKPRLKAFIHDCARSGRLCIRVVHGKGLGSGQRGPVLKYAVDRWLRQWDPVLAFVSARQVDGGSGAIYVLLKSS